ncbi:uncharacterized protein TRAVEDRAFT_50902 [Trametes versicolor FP-101664 SS1]|uniref:uncharacterized protein n=1 Tax=Trametes versicolor (strain FP-101664) TaxID=717944 RepID=UPI00046218F2|nr:uncharacterized protein TRAVEDRAFT_50902 [Trametes versicolor FP-101664 SS1]EIW54765.1 hypothetical protein TRAVEDRAFT_50902 [Trametes versicolor FP-101664 SS1]
MHISQCGDAGVPFDVPPYLLPLDLRVKLHEARAAPYRKPSNISATDTDARPTTSSRPRKRQRTMPSLLNRLTGTASYPIVLAQYKNEFRGVGHEPALHWVLVVITDKATLSGPSFQAYAQTSRPRHPRPRRPRLSDISDATASSSGSRRSTSAVVTMGTLALDGPAAPGATDTQQETKEVETETDVQWYTRHGKASLFDVCATVRTLCLGGVQVGSVKAADLDKLCEYLRSHPPVPSNATPGWCSRDYVLELLGAATAVQTAAGGPPRQEAEDEGRESIDTEDYRPFVKYHSA